MKPYLYRKGIKEIVAELSGQERIHVGIRPYGFHAGNVSALASYPVLLCQDFQKYHNMSPGFTFVISINDWEQDALDGPNYRIWPFNILPKNTTIKYLSTAHDPNINMVDYWQGIISRIVTAALSDYSDVKIEFYRNSELKHYPAFKELLLSTIKDPERQANIYRNYSTFEVLPEPIMYASVVCPHCKSARNPARVVLEDSFEVDCQTCGSSSRLTYDDADFWWHHKPLLLARLAVYNIDITLSGGDHYSEGDFILRQAFINEYTPELKTPKMIFSPTIISPIDNYRMSKTYKNTFYADYRKLTQFLDKQDEEKVLLDLACTLQVDEEGYEEYSNSL